METTTYAPCFIATSFQRYSIVTFIPLFRLSGIKLEAILQNVLAILSPNESRLRPILHTSALFL